MEENILLNINSLNISIKNQILFENFNFQIKAGEVTGLYAPTGTGKTTLFNYINGFIKSSTDENMAAEKKAGKTSSKENQILLRISGTIEKVEKLSIANVFQDTRLIEDLTALKNVSLPVEKIYSKEEALKKAYDMLCQVSLESKAYVKASALSGGQKQRLAIARAFLYPSALLLLDEPFSSQDDEQKKQLIELTKKHIEETGSGCLLISHNKEDLSLLCSRILTEKDFINS